MNILDDGPIFIGPHACLRFRERVAPLSDAEAKAAILLGLSGLDGNVSLRVQLDTNAVIATVRRGTHTFRAVLRKGSGPSKETAVVTILPKEPTHVTEKRFRARRAAITDEALDMELEMEDFDAA